MPVQYFDINDQYNQKNIEAAKKWKEEEKKWCDSKNGDPWKSLCMIPEEDDEAIEVKR